MSNKRTLNNLTSIIGSVTKKHEEQIKTETQEITLKKPEVVKIKPDNSQNITHTAEYDLKQVKGIKIQSRVAKVPESFKIKPSLKSIVEEIVKEARSGGQNISKGELYNLLIARGLEEIN